jgi:hypothetical protein
MAPAGDVVFCSEVMFVIGLPLKICGETRCQQDGQRAPAGGPRHS